MRKILLIRFSSIGDVMLTTPVIRAVRTCWPDAEIHCLTKAANAPLLEHHPLLKKLHLLQDDLGDTLKALKAEGFDLVLDLHSSLRSRKVRASLGVRWVAYRKGSLRTRLYTRWRIGSLEDKHVVQRHLEALAKAGCNSKPFPLELHLSADTLAQAKERLHHSLGDASPVAVNLGGKHATKKWIPAHWAELLNTLGRPVVLLGGSTEVEEAKCIVDALNVPCLNAVNNASLAESAALLGLCDLVLTHDSGLMHVAAALGKPIVSIWGHSVPAFGFTPWMANDVVVETTGLSCRPCSKLGHDACPKGHFRCMRDITPAQVMAAIRQLEERGRA